MNSGLQLNKMEGLREAKAHISIYRGQLHRGNSPPGCPDNYENDSILVQKLVLNIYEAYE